MSELRDRAAAKGIQITPKGFKTAGRYYRIESWDQVLAMAQTYDPLVNQITRWLRAA